MSDFDATTAIAVKKNEDGLYEKTGNFDPTTAKPIATISAAKGQQTYSRGITEQDRARAVVELSYKESGEQVPVQLKADWLLTSPEAQAVTTGLLAPEFTVWQGLRGAIQNRGQFNLLGNIIKGIVEPENTKKFTQDIPGMQKLPAWAQTVAGVIEDVVGVGALSISKAALKQNLLIKNINKKIDLAAEEFANENMARMLPTEQAKQATIKEQLKQGFKNEFLRKASALDAEITASEGMIGTGSSGNISTIEQYAKNKTLIGLLVEDLQMAGERGSLRIPKVGETVNFLTKDLVTHKPVVKTGVIKAIEGERALILMEGRAIVSSLSQISVPPPPEAIQQEEQQKPQEQTQQKQQEIIAEPQKENIPAPSKKIKQKQEIDLSNLPQLQKQIASMEDRIAKTEIAQNALEELDYVRQNFKHRITKYKDEFLKEELTGIPSFYISKTGGIKPDEALDELRNNYGVDLEDEVALKEYLQDLDATKKSFETEIEREKPGFITKRETTLLADKIKAVEMGYRAAKSKTKTEVAKTQTDLIEILEQSGLEPEDRAKFMRLVKNIQTPTQLEGILPEVVERIESLRERAERNEAIAAIENIFNTYSTKSMDLDYKDKIEEIKKQFITGGVKKRESMRQFVERMAEQGEEINIPDEYLHLLDQPSLKELTLDELKDLQTALERLYHLGKLKNKLLTVQQDRLFSDIVQEGVSVISKEKGLNNEEGIIKILKEQNKSWKDKTKENIRDYLIGNLRPELLINMLDNFDPQGINTQVMWNSLWQAQEAEMISTNSTLTRIREVLKDIDLPEILSKKYNIGRFKGITKDNVLAVYAYSLNEKARMRLLNTGFTEQDISDIAAFLRSPEAEDVKNLLTFYDEEQYLDIDAVYSGLEGVHLPYEENYFPMDRVEDISYNKELERDILERNYIARAGMAKGFTKARVTSNKGFSELSFISTILRNLNKVEHYKAFAPAVRDVNKYLNNKEIKQAIIENFGEYYYQSLTRWLKDVAYGGEKLPKTKIEKLVLFIRTNYVTSMIGINFSSMLKAPLSFLQGAEMAGKGSTIKALGKFILDPLGSVKATEEKSPIIKFRFFNQQRELQEMVQGRGKLEKITGKSRGWRKIKETSMLPWQIFDKATVTIVWNGAFQEAITDGMEEKEAMDFADKVIRRTQPMAGTINLPEVFMGNSFQKLFTTFKNQQNQNFNLGFEAIAQKNANKVDWKKLGSSLSFYWLIPAYLLGVIVRQKMPDAKEFAKDVLNQAVGGIVLLGNLTNWLAQGFMGEATPLESFGADLYGMAQSKKLNKMIDKILSVVSKLSGAPYLGFKRIISGEPLGKKKKRRKSWL